MIQKLLKLIKQYKIITIIAIISLITGGSFVYSKIFVNKKDVLYLTSQVQKGNLVISVSGSGYVSTSNQIDIKPKTGGEVVYVGVKNGQEVKAGTLLVQVDAKEAEKAVRDAEVNLESAKLSLEKLKKPADNLSLLQAENSLNQAKESKQKAEDDLKKAYEDGFNTVSNAFLDLPEIMAGLEDMMFDKTIDPRSSGNNNLSWYVNQTDYQTGAREKAILYMNDVTNIYNQARKVYEKNFNDYKAASRTAEGKIIEILIMETYETAKIIADTIKAFDNYIDFVQDDMEKRNLNIPSMVLTHQTNVSSNTSKINSHLLNLLAIKNKIEDSKKAITDAERLITEKTEYLAKLKAGADALDIKAAELAVKQRENALLDAKEKLEDYFIRAPFDGIIAKFDVKKGDIISPSTSLGTIITKQKIAEISLNEVDAVKVKTGQKATLTFDALPDFTISGKVAEIDNVGTVSQGVVSYNVKISFDTQDERIKAGMSISATIIIEVKPNIILVPNSAIKSQGQTKYVEMPSDNELHLPKAKSKGAVFKNPLKIQPVEVGLSNDEFTEIISGLKEGDIIVTRIIQLSDTKPPQQQNSFRLPGFPNERSGRFRR